MSGSSPSCTTIWATSTWSRRLCNPWTTRSARGCYLCLRYRPLPMSSDCTPCLNGGESGVNGPRQALIFRPISLFHGSFHRYADDGPPHRSKYCSSHGLPHPVSQALCHRHLRLDSEGLQLDHGQVRLVSQQVVQVDSVGKAAEGVARSGLSGGAVVLRR